MNALVAFRTHGVGTTKPTPRERAQKQGPLWLNATPRSVTPKAASGTTSAKGVDPASGVRTPEQELGRDAFLQLLVLQMQHQDPTDPVENGEMLAQLAQFSALEEMERLNGAFAVLAGNIDQLNFISASSLVGQWVTGVDMFGEPIEGIVERVHLDGSIVYLTVDDRLMSMAGVMGLGEPPAPPDVPDVPDVPDTPDVPDAPDDVPDGADDV